MGGQSCLLRRWIDQCRQLSLASPHNRIPHTAHHPVDYSTMRPIFTPSRYVPMILAMCAGGSGRLRGRIVEFRTRLAWLLASTFAWSRPESYHKAST